MKDNIVESLERMRRYLKKMKPTDDYVRGYKDAKLMMDETLKRAVEHIKCTENREHWYRCELRELYAGKNKYYKVVKRKKEVI